MSATTHPLRRLHAARVTDEHIDHLGHMNVRFYQEKAFAATDALAAAHGLGPDAARALGGELRVRDAFTRHYREQLVGAELAVLGGFLAVRADGFRAYHELVNTESGERAAVFVHDVALAHRDDGRALALPEAFAKGAADALVAWPEHGRPRTIDLGRVPDGLTLAEARRRGLAMRQERAVGPDECGADGRYAAAGYLALVWGGEPPASRGEAVPMLETIGEVQFGWATLESRATLLALPRLGTRIQSFGAEVALARKTSFRHHWVFDVATGVLLCAHSVVNLAFDIAARKSLEIPPHVRARLETQYHPDLR